MDREMDEILLNDNYIAEQKEKMIDIQNKIQKINTERTRLTGELVILKNNVQARKIELRRKHNRIR